MEGSVPRRFCAGAAAAAVVLVVSLTVSGCGKDSTAPSTQTLTTALTKTTSSESTNTTISSTAPQCSNGDFVSSCNISQKAPIHLCPNKHQIGTFALYLVPCNAPERDQLYNIDPGWGGAHMTITSFHHMTRDHAVKKFNRLQRLMVNAASEPNASFKTWYPSFMLPWGNPRGDWRALMIDVGPLDGYMGRMIEHAGYKLKGLWHMTMANWESQFIFPGMGKVTAVTDMLRKTSFSLVLVECHQVQNGQVHFKRHGGFTLLEKEDGDIDPGSTSGGSTRSMAASRNAMDMGMTTGGLEVVV